MSNVRSIALGTVILAGPTAIFILIAILPFDYVSWLGGGLIGLLLVVMIPGLFCIALLRLAIWQRAVGALLYVVIYVPFGILAGTFACLLLLSRSV